MDWLNLGGKTTFDFGQIKVGLQPSGDAGACLM